MRLRLPLLFSALLALACAPLSRAEYIVLRNGSRLVVTGYELIGDKYRLQMKGGVAEISADEVASIEPDELFEPLPEPLSDTTPFHKLILTVAGRYGLDPDLLHCVIAVESNFNPRAVSRKNASGLMQLIPSTAKSMGVHNVFDPSQNVDGGAHYLQLMLARYDRNLTLALAAYNAGPERVDQYGRNVPPYYETRAYVDRIQRFYAKVKAESPEQKSARWAKLDSLSLLPANSNSLCLPRLRVQLSPSNY